MDKDFVKTSQILLQTSFFQGDTTMLLYLENDQIGVRWQGVHSSSSWLSADTTPVSDGRWHHIAVTYNQQAPTLYKDGVSTGEAFPAGDIIGAGSTTVNLGGASSDAGIPSFAVRSGTPRSSPLL